MPSSPSRLSNHNKTARLNKTKQRIMKNSPKKSKSKNKPSLSSQDHYTDSKLHLHRPRSPGGDSTTSAALHPSTSNPYKGFDTSISSIFTNPRHARVDCCAISCCGVFQSDYNRYVLFGKRPPTFKNRFVQHIFIPLFLFCAAGYAAVFIKDRNANQFLSTTLLFLSIFWVIGGCLQGTHKRSVTRRDMMRYTKITEIVAATAKNHDKNHYSLSSLEERVDLEQTEAEMTAAHRMCGCYPSDNYNIPDDDDDDQGLEHGESGTSTDFCSKLSRLYAALCCGKIFRCQLQLCGACALAQEGRQIDAIVPAERRRIDYITFEPYMSYFNEIRSLRKEVDGRMWRHYLALSKLSRILIKCLLGVVIFLNFVSLILKPANFNWGNMVVFLCTFLQTFLVLYFVHWEWNRFDISLDAVVKFFACGFVISTSSAVAFELFESFVLRMLSKLLMLYLPLEQSNYDGYSSSSALFFGFSIMDPYTMYSQGGATAPMAATSEYKRAFQRQYPGIAIAFLFLSAYFVAALVEEACKYFGFIVVEHPDFMTLKQIKKAASYGVPDPSAAQEEDRFEWGGGLDCGSGLFCTSQESAAYYESFDDGDEERNNHDDDDDDDDSDDDGDEEESRERAKHTVKSTILGGMTMKRVELVDAPPRTIQTIGSAITVAMVTVALGFACCENLIYIFLYNGGSLGQEISVLISRSLFPVHPICAAIQSIGLCKQKLERDSSMTLGRILFPAMMLHGSFDFVIMVLNFVAQMSEGDENNNNNNNGDDDDSSNSADAFYGLIGLFLSFGFIIGGLFYYFKESDAQQRRINQIDGARTFVGIKA